MVCRLNKSLYGLKQAPRASYSRFATFLVTLGFTEAKSDTSRFVYRHGDETAYLLLYVDDIVLTASSQHLLQWIITSLQQEFAMKDLGVLHHFLGVTVEPRPSGLLLHQRQYTLDILERAGMTDRNPCSTPVDTQAKISEDAGPPVADPTAYRSLAGALQYLTFTRPDITYAVQQLLAELHSPLAKSTLVYCDNVSAVYLSTNPVQHQRTKHVEIDLHFVRDRVTIGDVRVLHVPTTSQFADIFTKGLPSATFSEFRSSLNITSG
ncbi:hypothetical protein U9M48_035178 [Paspalum notatum var. saurae]|uniref:Reverse transcriptase Ty1/copia-type domain-containing protein n=1 Tax=Paspalum notatum var. saurae TaxID=547442 RepID=A0AAQ3X7M4_PASNO